MEHMLSFSRIHIIERLRPDDRRTGQESYRDLRAILAATGSRLDAQLHRVSSVSSFLVASHSSRSRRMATMIRERRSFNLTLTSSQDECIALGVES